MINTSYLLNFDVLGFGQFVMNNPTQVVFDHYSKIITGASFAGQFTGLNNIDVMVYSDTIAVRFKDNNESMCFEALLTVARLTLGRQYYSALSKESVFFPIRGVLTYGEYIFHKGNIWTQAFGRPKISSPNINMIIGKPIIESYELEKNLNLIAVIIGDSAISQIDETVIKRLVTNNTIVEYEIPLKENRFKSGYIVNPTQRCHFDLNISKLEYEKDKHIDSPEIVEKYTNTIKLFNYINQHNLYYCGA